MDFTHSDRSLDFQRKVKRFIDEHLAAVDSDYQSWVHANNHARFQHWQPPPYVAELKREAKEQGLWNLFLPDPELGQGLSTTEYAPLAEAMGHCLLAPEVFNCNAPDSGNMEVLYHFGTPEQQQRWLKPLLAAEIRSVFCMTEPAVASSDATNIEASIAVDGEDLVLNGRKWWTTGLGHPQAEVAIFMGISDADAPRHQRHSMVLVPLDTPGVKIERMLSVLGDYDPPYGHGEVVFNDVRVPKDHLICGLGQGFAIAQGRLGPGRIHHCMRAIGASERALSLMIERGSQRIAFGKPLLKLGGNADIVADLRMAIDQARLLTQYAAWRIDNGGARQAMKEISAIKVVAPNVLEKVVDAAIQIFGAEGVSDQTPLASLLGMARALRLADGPDAVHRALVGRLEIKEQTQ
ncbi:MAG: acyl-CoA dehydrogenase [Lysobacteraceae bacterium]|nr:MAG: acyl-CoA dehydrogenase [Xanthomonadaceae bacterium]